ncbi:M56 family peptidase [Amycolatopsis balhimycina DSM 5908]|uniref:M56 family peptidase n=1 Tax=Amycolatopsis balhimycina DSM 5908 TaxID=1081091 RepID=A0A428WHT6_AMYBA|nr:M56 family metallopeptidase [Amycolatopsis balhimycina]RSM42648.1 M56 family peptidase [Amycolatopsis balhimycina DSM 5908]
MDTDFWVPLLLPFAAWPLARIVVPRLPPRAASWLLTSGCLVLAAASTAALTLQAFAGLTLVPAIAQAGHWSPQALNTVEPVNVPLAIGCGLLLSVLGLAFTRTAVRYARWSRALTRELDEHDPATGIIILRGQEPVAFSAPGRGGRIAISSGMLDALGPAERDALLAHERAHLRLRHHRFLIAITLAAALNPLLRPLCSAARFALERWADEAAAQDVGDRTVVAKAVAKAALAGRAQPGFALAATGGPVPRRVSALLTAPARRLPAALLSATLVLGVTGWSAQTVLDAATDLHQNLESAQDVATDAPGVLPDDHDGFDR